MTTTIHNLLRQKSVLLASKSPRRVEILRTLGVPCEVRGATFAEDLDHAHFASPADYVVTNAREKALEVFHALKKEGKTHDVVIGADTVVVLGTQILEKPNDVEHAVAILRRLRDAGDHQVVTGMCLVLDDPAAPGGERIVTFHESTTVSFGAVSDQEIDWYVGTGDPMDKAGGYGYQSLASPLIKGIHGCYYNVVGLPVHRLFRELETAMMPVSASH
ncbi:inosine triphosphate pyrophosphatase-like protein [Blastocladiella britannica]|nr:inosine triphosphate pyrophosphatase-like protein [Blastocladiella britannica]